MVQVAPELVEAMPMRQMLFKIAEVVFAELRGRVAARLENLGKCDVRFLQARRRPGVPTVVIPVRTGNCPVMNAARPAVQLGCA